MRLSELLEEDRVTVSLDAEDKPGVLRAIAALFCGPGANLQPADVLRVLSEREALASTGVGSGVAIPHGRIAGLPRMQAALAIHRSGVPFDAVDGEPVQIFLAVLAPERQPSEQLKALARISRLLRDVEVRQRLLSVANARAALQIVASREE